MRNRSDKLSKSKKMVVALCFTAAVIIITFVYIEKRVEKYSAEMSTYYCQRQISEAISKAVSSVLESTGADYSDLSTDIYDESGRFVSSEICTKNVNILQSMIVSEINENIGKLSKNEIEISAGTLSGLYLLHGYGPDVRLRLVPVGSARTELKSGFESAGINQLCHKISIDIIAEARTIFYSGSEAVSVSMNFILGENIISGEVPDGFIIKN